MTEQIDINDSDYPGCELDICYYRSPTFYYFISPFLQSLAFRVSQTGLLFHNLVLLVRIQKLADV